MPLANDEAQQILERPATLTIGCQTIPNTPGPYCDHQDWLDDCLIPAGQALASDQRCQGMGFDGRPLTELEMFAVSMAVRYSPESIAAQWMEDFNRFFEGTQ